MSKKFSRKKKFLIFFQEMSLKLEFELLKVKKREFNILRVFASQKKNRDLNSSFTVRKISFGEGVERTFPLYGTVIDSIKVIRSGKVRRAKLYYLRDRTGKSARIAEKIRKKIGINLDVKPETVNDENLVSVSKETELETKIETATALEPKKDDSSIDEPKKDAPEAKIKAEKKLENTPEKK